MKQYLDKLIQNQSLTQAEMSAATHAMLSEQVPEQIAAVLSLLRAKGETTAEILGVVAVLKEKMLTVPTALPCLDIVGTGGDGLNTVNISSGAAILAASCGVTVAKHGNRAVSSRCGSADVLQELGINIEMTPEQIAACLTTLHIAFCYAPSFHPALAQLRQVRKNLGIPTIFNLVGPLLNPCRPNQLILGVFSEQLLQPMADLLLALGLGKSVVVCAAGMDEISCSGMTQIIEVDQGQKLTYTLHPQQFGLPVHPISAIQGGAAPYNARLIIDALAGKPSPIADALLLNAAMAIYIYGLSADLAAAITLAKQQLEQGAGLHLLEQWRNFAHA